MGESPSFYRTGRRLPGRGDPRFWRLWQQGRPELVAHVAQAAEAALPDANRGGRREPERVRERTIFERG